MRMVATCARVAQPSGLRYETPFSPTPEIRPLPTAHAIAVRAHDGTLSASGKPVSEPVSVRLSGANCLV